LPQPCVLLSILFAIFVWLLLQLLVLWSSWVFWCIHSWFCRFVPLIWLIYQPARFHNVLRVPWPTRTLFSIWCSLI
jgi:hypothetical protein